MQEIKICIQGINLYNKDIKIYNLDGLLINYEWLNQNTIKIMGKRKNFYRLVISGLTKEIIINQVFYVNDRELVNLNFFRTIKKKKIITIKLTDALYSNLPIKKGEIILWSI